MQIETFFDGDINIDVLSYLNLLNMKSLPYVTARQF